eukprot:5066897-Ditylum_brightwellii.AAC.1
MMRKQLPSDGGFPQPQISAVDVERMLGGEYAELEGMLVLSDSDHESDRASESTVLGSPLLA